MNPQIILGKEYPDVVIPFIKSARSCLDILVYEWNFYQQQPAAKISRFNQEIFAAARRGVSVEALVGRPSISSIYKQSEIKIKKPVNSSLVHSKLLIIDERIAILGSHNFTHSAFTINHEVSVVLTDASSVTSLLDFFNSLNNPHAFA
jgi:phosphatidylserine/phosphatidylglycerophosphate/cardiolipin synthase-like enzyme